MAKLQGYKVIGTTSKNKEARARSLNCCDELIVLESVKGKNYADYESTPLYIQERVLEVTKGAGAKLVLDGVGKSTVDISLACLARRGIFVSFGNASGAVPPFPLLRLSPKSAFVTRPKLADYIATAEELQKRCEDVFMWIREGRLHVTVDKVFPLEQAADGHLYLESGQSQGKILYRILNP
jgi:NADPH2:quinone reductase